MTFTTPAPELNADDRAALTFTLKRIVFIENDSGTPVGKLSDVELHFENGTKLAGFAIWESRYRAKHNVTVPARQYSVNGERRTYALLRPDLEHDGMSALTDAILKAWTRHKVSAPAAEPAARESYEYGRAL